MNVVDLKDLVSTAVRENWGEFEQKHPHLAAALDETMVVEEGMALLSQDADFQQAIANANAIGTIGQDLAALARRVVGDWFSKIAI